MSILDGDMICDSLEPTASAPLYHDIRFFLASPTSTGTNVPLVHSSEVNGLLV
jgi:hypothetical protein